MPASLLTTAAAYDEGYADAASQTPIWQALGQNFTDGIVRDRAYIEGYVSYFSAEDQGWVRAECWATRAFALGQTTVRPSTWGLNELPILTIIS
jgi:hypothetical protein